MHRYMHSWKELFLPLYWPVCYVHKWQAKSKGGEVGEFAIILPAFVLLSRLLHCLTYSHTACIILDAFFCTLARNCNVIFALQLIMSKSTVQLDLQDTPENKNQNQNNPLSIGFSIHPGKVTFSRLLSNTHQLSQAHSPEPQAHQILAGGNVKSVLTHAESWMQWSN